jgi:hypothetical protein
VNLSSDLERWIDDLDEEERNLTSLKSNEGGVTIDEENVLGPVDEPNDPASI